jgi:hypothetical protein
MGGLRGSTANDAAYLVLVVITVRRRRAEASAG